MEVVIISDEEDETQKEETDRIVISSDSDGESLETAKCTLKNASNVSKSRSKSNHSKIGKKQVFKFKPYDYYEDYADSLETLSLALEGYETDDEFVKEKNVPKKRKMEASYQDSGCVKEETTAAEQESLLAEDGSILPSAPKKIEFRRHTSPMAALDYPEVNRRKMSKRRASESAKLSPVKKRCVMNFLRGLKEETSRTHAKPKQISRKGVQQLIQDPKVVLERIPKALFLQMPKQSWDSGSPCGSSSNCSTPQHRHFLDVLQSSSEEEMTPDSGDVTPSQHSAKLQASAHNKFLEGITSLTSTVAKQLRLRKKYERDEEDCVTGDDVLPDLPDDPFQPKKEVESPPACSNLLKADKLMTIWRREHKESSRCNQVSESGDSSLLEVVKVGREVHRVVHDRWWCCLPPRQHCQLCGLQVVWLRKFPKAIINIIDGGIEEGLSSLVIDLIKDFASQKTEPPPQGILRHLLNDVLLNSKTLECSVKTNSILRTFLDFYPPFMELCFSWDDFDRTLGRLCSATNFEESNTNLLYALSYMVESFEVELSQHSFMSQRNILKSSVCRMLNVDSHLQRLKLIINTLGTVMYRNELESTEDFLSLNLGGLEKKTEFLPKLIFLVQRSLTLGLVTSRRQHEAAAMVVMEISLVYKRLACLAHRKVLVETSTWPVLRLQLVQRILEDQCNGSHVNSSCLTLPMIFKFYVEECTPPCDAVTPPLTPSDDGDSDERFPRTGLYSESSCEELAFLLYQLVETYIVFHKRGHSSGLHRRLLDNLVDEELGEVDRRANLVPKVAALEQRLRAMCHLTSQTKLYFLKMECLLMSIA